MYTKEEVYTAYCKYLESVDIPVEEYVKALYNLSTFKTHLHDIYSQNLRFEYTWQNTADTFSFLTSSQGYGYWRSHFTNTDNRTPIKEVLEPFFPTPLTNEEMLAIFLKEHRLYSSYKRQVDTTFTRSMDIADILNYSLDWRLTTEGHDKWQTLHHKFQKLCEDLQITGTIDLSKLPR